MSVMPFALEGFELQPFTSSTASNTTSIERAQVRGHRHSRDAGITPLVAAFAQDC